MVQRTLGGALTREDMEEAVSDAFLALWNHVGDYDSAKGAFLPWLGAIARNRALNKLWGVTPALPLLVGVSSCSTMLSGVLSTVLGTSYTSEDSDLVGAEQDYVSLEAGLKSEIDNIERDHPGYDEYRYQLDEIGHNPHELVPMLTAIYPAYTRSEVQAELQLNPL